ncbi:hypothetical protein DAEQUDRAFT_763280 [Daedalea quercina L-15889]|uniref:Uncharacterized protein n=1 Tax=Daedalea quercina L-15889 TaxID=1314783 RepID=A0A165SLB5_9APHY|nr:hypothetical protein DAEQUDRAFT_763280 [Daedalea quercina L-15889]
MTLYDDFVRALGFCCLCTQTTDDPKSRRRNRDRFNPLEEDVYEPPVLLNESLSGRVTQSQPNSVSIPSMRDHRLSGLPPYTPRPVPIAMPPAYHPGAASSPTSSQS